MARGRGPFAWLPSLGARALGVGLKARDAGSARDSTPALQKLEEGKGRGLCRGGARPHRVVQTSSEAARMPRPTGAVVLVLPGGNHECSSRRQGSWQQDLPEPQEGGTSAEIAAAPALCRRFPLAAGLRRGVVEGEGTHGDDLHGRLAA